MSKINVIEFIPTMGDGGAETLVKDYAQLLDKEQFDVTVVVLRDIGDSANIRRLEDKSIRVIALSRDGGILQRIWHMLFLRKNTINVDSEAVKEKIQAPCSAREKKGLISSVRHYLRNLYFGLKFVRVLRKCEANVVHAHLDVLHCLQTVSWFLKGVRLLHTSHGPVEIVYDEREGKAARYLIKNNGMQTIALHAQMAQEMDALFPGHKTHIIRNGINMEQFRNPGVTSAEKRRELGIPEDAFLVGHVGRFTPEKNHTFLVDVFKEITVRQENAYLLMVGAEDHTAVENKLCLLGLQGRYQILSGRKDINELLAAMDVFVFPSIFEGFSIAMLEAQAAGLRCIVSSTCPSEMFRTAGCIDLPLEDAGKWAQMALDTDVKRENTKPLDEYDMNREIRKLEKLYLGQQISD